MKKLFDIEDIFDEDYYFYMQRRQNPEKEADFIIKEMNLKKDDEILDIGTGNGRIIFELHKKGFRNLTGIDLSKKFIEIAREKNKDNTGVNLICDNFLNYNFSKSFDKIFFLFTGFGYFDDKTNEEIIKKISTLLPRDGVFLLDIASMHAVNLQAQKNIKKEFNNLSYDVSGQIDEENSTLRTICKIEDKTLNKNKEYNFCYRFYTPEEINKMFKKYGLDTIKTFGYYDGEKMAENSKRNIYIAKKA